VVSAELFLCLDNPNVEMWMLFCKGERNQPGG
jgi:hypothetical protein